MGVTPGGVHDERAGVSADGLGEGFGALLNDDVPPPDLIGHGGVEYGIGGVFARVEGRNDDFVFEAGFALRYAWSESRDTINRREDVRLGP